MILHSHYFRQGARVYRVSSVEERIRQFDAMAATMGVNGGVS
jgi:hypothetical protein